ncbi:hypothetical protein B1B04_07175 [Lysinibacillus sp. KCTC 33748]|uniref:hypothetical protein n=1 Tax=unclassified Lysinibacillus TaxID=2636778 RepID=UPI0009A8734B|nr:MULTISPECIES: hypothetical protein [unclassified Lysinibacillus]OXS75491.1 hypothetical protein B1B04_07175 [Lysinibacillus sp. KCTC 33748]SKB54132.1 hypothetical protein SAMN06295926_103300 [Lysinibacillus sp. AC-3]
MKRLTLFLVFVSLLVLGACSSTSETKDKPEEATAKVIETVVTGKEIEELIKAGETDKVEKMLNESTLEPNIDIEAVKSYITFLKSDELMSLKTAKLMDSVDFGYSGILSTEISNAIYLPHEEGSLITGIFKDREGFDYIDWKYNDAKDAYFKAKDYSELSVKVEVEKALKKKLVEEAKGKNPHIGMTKEEVEASLWGQPETINRTVTEYSIHEQWVYGQGQYLYFTDGTLTSFQD